jgi:hypothetical protein
MNPHTQACRHARKRGASLAAMTLSSLLDSSSVPLNTLSASICAPGAVASATAAVVVPWPSGSRAGLSRAAPCEKSSDAATLQPGAPGAAQLPNSGRDQSTPARAR